MARSILFRIVMLPVVLAALSRAWAADWPGFRGPARDGRSAETGLLTSWPDGGPPRVATIAGLGRGYSSPAIVAGRIYITGASDQTESAFCFDLAGKKLWQTQIAAGVKPPLAPRSTPAADGRHVFVRNMLGAVVCLDAASGRIDWTVDVLKEFSGVLPPANYVQFRWDSKTLTSFFGGDDWSVFNDEKLTESVLLEGDMVICTPGGKDATLAALDSATGQTRWTSRGLSDVPSCCSPIAFDFGGVRQIATVTDSAAVGVRASDGTLLWRCELKAQIACPLYHDGILFIGGSAGAVRLSAEGPEFAAAQLYEIPPNKGWAQGGFDAANMLTMGAVLNDGLIYGSSSDYDRARTCLDLATAKPLHHLTENTMCGRATGPVLLAENLLYYQSEFGAMRLIECTPKKTKPISTFWFPYLEGRTTAHPAISDRKLFIRNHDRLFIYNLAANATFSPSAAPATAPAPRPLLAARPKPVWDADWPGFRGPNRDGRSPETGLLKSWPDGGPKLLLTIDPGTGGSSPAIVGDRIYIGGATGRDGFLRGYDTAGNLQWQTPIGTVVDGGGTKFGPASTPTIDCDYLYFITDSGTVLSLDRHSGQERWRTDVHKLFRGRVAAWAHTESILVEKDTVICSPGGPDAALVALDKNTGTPVWQSRGISDWAGNGSIIAFDFAGQRLLATLTSRSLLCLTAADGKLLFRYDRPSTSYAPYGGWCEATGGHNVSTPLFTDGLLAAFNIHCSGGAVRLTSEGPAISAEQIWDSHALWPKASGYIAVDGYLYGCSLPGNGSAFVCIDLATGKTMFSTTENDTGGPFLWADGMFICTGFRSTPSVCLIEQTPTALKKVSRFKFAGECISYPALSHGRLYLRPMSGKLYIYDLRDPSAHPL